MEPAESHIRSETTTFLFSYSVNVVTALVSLAVGVHRPAPVTCFSLKRVWRGIRMPASRSESCLPAPFLSGGGQGYTRNRCGFFSRTGTALAEHFSCARCVSG